jgi:hypothetical protein
VPLDTGDVLLRGAEGVREAHIAAASEQLLVHLAAVEGSAFDGRGTVVVLARAGARALASRIELAGCGVPVEAAWWPRTTRAGRAHAQQRPEDAGQRRSSTWAAQSRYSTFQQVAASLGRPGRCWEWSDTHMALEVVRGESRNRSAAEALAAKLRSVVDEGTVYLAYPVLATADERVEVDALLVSRAHGLVAFLLATGHPEGPKDWAQIVTDQDRLYAVIEGHLRRHEALRSGRRLALTPSTATVFPSRVSGTPDGAEGFYGELNDVPGFVQGLPPIPPETERALQAALQRVSTIKPPKKRAGVQNPASRGATLKDIERNIANLDQWQKAAAIESPEGPQRIRGLAGSGKTIVLALKAAYWHSQHPHWRIALTFHTRALYQQMADLTTRFTFEHTNDSPDPEYLQIIHSWGSSAQPGVYSMIAAALGETPRD